MDDSTLARFLPKTQPSDCVLWTGCLGGDGYGWLTVDGRAVPAHRLAYEHFVGPIPEGFTVDHLCRNRSCVNPEYLEPVTRGDNVLRGVGFAAANARKTHCPQGHPYDEVNTEYEKHGWRRGRTCRIEQAERRRRRGRVVRAAA